MARGPWGAGEETVIGVRIHFTLNGSKCQTGFKVRHDLVDDESLADIAEAVASWVTTSFRTIFQPADTFQGVDVVNLTTKEGHYHDLANLGGSGSGGSDGEKSFVCVWVSLRGELRARYGQGRMAWPVRYEQWSTNDALNDTGLAAMQGVLTALNTRFLGASGSEDVILVNAHGALPPRAATEDSPARPAIPPTYYDVTGTRLSRALRPLKSRISGVGS